jgi:hypothetical protein
MRGVDAAACCIPAWQETRNREESFEMSASIYCGLRVTGSMSVLRDVMKRKLIIQSSVFWAPCDLGRPRG